jgi:hypothetical protein
MTSNQFVGAWKLIASEMRFPDGRVFYPFGKIPAGYIIYTNNGYMTATLTATKRSRVGLTIEKLAMPSKIALFTPKYLKAAYRYFRAATSFVSYSGPYEIKGDRIIHHVEVSLFPEWTGTDLIRTYEFSGNKLFLRAAIPGGGIYEFSWERMEP